MSQVRLNSTEERKRALIDATVGLVGTMLLWPFPVARAMLSPLVHVLLIVATWAAVNVIYHIVCARAWRRTAALHLLGYSLCDAARSSGGCAAVDNRTAMRWGVVAGVLVVATACSARVAQFVCDASGVELCRSADGAP